MKLFISCDIEGTAGIAAWDEAEKGGRWYDYFCRQMSLEVAAACEGAMKAGVTDILVKDAHDTARNIDPSLLPEGVQINRGWNGGLLEMVAGLSGSFDAVAFTGYHSPAGGAGNPLAHTMHTRLSEITINGTRASEFTIASYTAGMLGVPVVFLSGDGALCREAVKMLPGLTAVAVSEGEGEASTSPHPAVAAEMIRQGMRRAIKGDFKGCVVEMPPRFEVAVRYHSHHKAFSSAYYPGARQLDEHSVGFEHEEYMEVLRFFHFAL